MHARNLDYVQIITIPSDRKIPESVNKIQRYLRPTQEVLIIFRS